MRFGVVDDNKDFLKAVEAEWEDIQGAYPDVQAAFLRLGGRTSIPDLVNGLAGCNHLLLDVSALSKTIVEAIAAGVPDAKLWMMTGKADASEIEKWQVWCELCENAQAEWFEKPIVFKQVLRVWSETGAVNPRDAATPADLNIFPVPCRWFDSDRIAVRTNCHWRIAVDAFPNYLNQEDVAKLDRGEAIVPLDTWSEYPDCPGHFGKVRYATRAWAGGYLQLGLSLPKATGDTVANAVSDIFALMLGGGAFSRARYYEIIRVPGSLGIMRLSHSTHSVALPLPLEQPLGATLAERVAEYDREFEERFAQPNIWGRLVYYVRKHEQEKECEDSDIRYWQKHAGTGKAPWLTLPVCSRGEMKHAVALLVFDRLGRANGAGDVAGEEIPKKLVESLAPKLLGAIHHLREAMRQESLAAELTQRKQMAEWRRLFAARADSGGQTSESGLSGLENIVLDAAKQLTGATSALLALRPAAANYLESRTESEDLLSDLCFNFDRRHFIAVQCALKKEPIYLPDYHVATTPEQEITEDDWRNALAHRTEHERKRLVPQLMEWQKTELRSVIALPVSYGDELLGVLVLRHRDAYHFTDERVVAASTLVEEAHPFLRRARLRAARDAWDTMIFHEVRSGLSHIRAQADYVLHPSPSRDPAEAARAILARTGLMTDLSSEIMAILGYSDHRTDARTYDRHQPLNLLNDLWTEMATLPEAAGKTLQRAESLSPLLAPLDDPNGALPHVLRVLLENALRYGKPGEIVASHEANGSQWRLCLCNPGKISEDALLGAFNDLSSRADLAQESLRAHIGLAACRRVLEGLGGRLDLRNHSGNGCIRACVTLLWPLVKVPDATPHTSVENNNEPRPQE